MMIVTKLISIDTSVFGNLAKDYFSRNETQSSQAKDTTQHLINNGFIPLITMHHLQEIQQYKDDTGVFKRWSLIKVFPFIAWVTGYKDKHVPATVEDIHMYEIQMLLRGAEYSLDRLVGEVKNYHIKYTSGEQFVTQFEWLYAKLRSIGAMSNERPQAIESLTHTIDESVANLKLSTLFESQLRTPEEVFSQLQEQEGKLTTNLAEKGDKKLTNPSAIARKLMNEVLQLSGGLYSSDMPLYDKFIHCAGVRSEQVTPDMTIGQLGSLGAYNKALRGILESMGLPVEQEQKLPREKLYTRLLWEHLDDSMKRENRAAGSNMLDKHMGVFALFSDVFIADKRVFEYFRQLRRMHPVIAKHVCDIRKLSGYADLTSID